MWAAQTNKTGTVQYLISRKADVHAHARGWNALFDAANSGHVGPARCLIEAGINVNSHRESSGMCPLSFACMHG
jgi:ankyrin repeat protein